MPLFARPWTCFSLLDVIMQAGTNTVGLVACKPYR
jgi:hypothetical protein